MAANLVTNRPRIHAKSSFALLSVLKEEKRKRHFCDDSAKKVNLYETLGINSSATQGEVKKAYYDLTLKYHPDKNVNNEEAALKFREISEAYEILGNYRSRKRYDRGLPVTDVKKIIKHAVDHKAQYQEFFDSRSTKQSYSSEARMKEIHDLGSFTQKKEREDAANEEKIEGNAAPVQIIFALFIAALVYFSR